MKHCGTTHTELGQSAVWIGGNAWRFGFWYRWPVLVAYPPPLVQCHRFAHARNVRVWRFAFTRRDLDHYRRFYCGDCNRFWTKEELVQCPTCDPPDGCPRCHDCCHELWPDPATEQGKES